MKKKSSYEGLQEYIKKLSTPAIETWANKYPERDYTVFLETSEFTCICPKTGLPDFATIKISYMPDKACIELKSFKDYLVSFRQVGIFHEHAVNRIMDDFVKASKPRWALVEGIFNTRGGIRTTVTAEYGKKR